MDPSIKFVIVVDLIAGVFLIYLAVVIAGLALSAAAKGIAFGSRWVYDQMRTLVRCKIRYG